MFHSSLFFFFPFVFDYPFLFLHVSFLPLFLLPFFVDYPFFSLTYHLPSFLSLSPGVHFFLFRCLQAIHAFFSHYLNLVFLSILIFTFSSRLVPWLNKLSLSLSPNWSSLSNFWSNNKYQITALCMIQFAIRELHLETKTINFHASIWLTYIYIKNFILDSLSRFHKTTPVHPSLYLFKTIKKYIINLHRQRFKR